MLNRRLNARGGCNGIAPHELGVCDPLQACAHSWRFQRCLHTRLILHTTQYLWYATSHAYGILIYCAA